jgi:hypothetical protein
MYWYHEVRQRIDERLREADRQRLLASARADGDGQPAAPVRRAVGLALVRVGQRLAGATGES